MRRARPPATAACLALAAMLGCGSSPPEKKVVDDTVDPADTGAPPPKKTPDAAQASPMVDGATAAPDAGADAAVSFPRRPSCTTAPSVVNGELEDRGASAVPGWEIETTGGATVQWDAISGYAGTGALAFRAPDDLTGGVASARQVLMLEPYTGYTFRARVATGNMHPRGDGFYLFTIAIKNGNRTFTVGPRKQDRTDLDYLTYSSDFATGPDGRVELQLRTAGTGHFVVDGIGVTCSDRSQRYAGQNLVLTVFDTQVQAATPTNIEKVIETVGKALVSFNDLTGHAADPVKASAFPSVAAATEPRGNPVLWSDGVTAQLWSVPGYAPQSMMTALARNHDRPAWSFEDEMSHLLVYHAAETNELVLGAPEMFGRGRDARRPYELGYNNEWKAGGCATGAGLVFKNILIRDKVGWEPFKKTYRYFDALTPAEVPATRWEKLKRWHDKLAEFSGMDVWATFTPLDRMLMDARYNAPPLPAARALATLPLTTLTVPLATIEWESATARDRPTRNRLSNDCALATAAGPVESGLYAPPFSQYVFRLGRRWKRLVTGHSLYAAQTGSVVFIVRGDGRELFKSPTVRDAMPRPLDLDVSMVDRLELIVTDAGDGNVSDGAVWVAPRLTR